MAKRKIDPDKPYGRLKRVDDFLPPPEKLVLPQETVKITISLSHASVVFFKKQAKHHHTKYQKMIRKLLDGYAARYSQAS
ncbi:MAG: CopG family transcriptional regulator [Candidatus Omnitrophica bacterium]|nr:CopG family transcriptional regulator [Candidatus Omnitrophota bacterium]